MENQKQNQLLETEIAAAEEIVKTDAQQIEVDTSDLKQEWKNTSQSSNVRTNLLKIIFFYFINFLIDKN